ncbi:nucleoside hydrolase [Neoactinobaculum massilliense]|uniref:nucleoside hydrolase n=1 Tax=Neoactinobaculum massilliense TaxID=2364794 RepID=UPI000F5479CD|nr:nucleoside hydrolase [Neoactinobaculum massilliense]
MAKPFILDTDTAQDDCVAILFGLLHPEADLRAITMVAGNVGFNRQVENAVMTLSVAGKLGEVPVCAGATQPLLRPWESAENVHGTGAGELELDNPWDAVSDEFGPDAIIRLTAENPGELSIVAIGPLTNIALAVAKDRSLPERVKGLYIMGGSNNGRGNASASGEFNFYVDPEAAEIVLTAGFHNVNILTWDPVTLRDVTYPRAKYNLLTQLGTPLSRFFGAVCDTTLAFNESVGVDGSTHPDSATVMSLVDPALVLESNEYRVDVETSSSLTRGFSAMAWGKFNNQPNATVIEKYDSEGFYEQLEKLLSIETTPSVAIHGITD